MKRDEIVSAIRGGAVITYEAIGGKLGWYLKDKPTIKVTNAYRVKSNDMHWLVDEGYVIEDKSQANRFVAEVWKGVVH